MEFTDGQVKFFRTFGFLSLPGLFVREIDRITDAYEQVWKDHGGGYDGRAHDHQRRSVLWPFIDDNEYLSSLIDDKRIKAIGTSLLGKGFNYASSDGNFYVGDTGWHSDTCRNFNYGPVMEDPSRSSHGYGAVKLAFYLDPLTRDGGCLRVIPGSHKVGDKFADSLQSEIFETEDRWGVRGKDVPAVPLETTPGDLLVFDLCTKHAAFGGGTRRRMFTINLQQRFSDKDLSSLRENIASMASTKGGAHRFGADRAYGEVMLRTASPQRMVHLQQRMDNDSLLRERLLKLANLDMANPGEGDAGSHEDMMMGG